MKLVFTKSNLSKAVGIVMKAVPTRTTMTILECILIDATTNKIKFTSNDMELGIETIVEGEIVEKGKIAIDAKLFSEIVRKLPDNDITIEKDINYTAVKRVSLIYQVNLEKISHIFLLLLKRKALLYHSLPLRRQLTRRFSQQLLMTITR